MAHTVQASSGSSSAGGFFGCLRSEMGERMDFEACNLPFALGRAPTL